MKTSNKYYDVTPLVVKAETQAQIRITPRYEHAWFPEAEKLKVQVVPCLEKSDGQSLIDWRLDNGSLLVTVIFKEEQRYLIRVESDDKRFPMDFNVYALNPDLYSLRPYKGDFHIHTMRSDGRESPEYVAARYREAGFDFIAISDHHRYEPSLEAIDYWNRYSVGLKMFPGEEVHPPDCPVHMLNFGGSYSINELFKDEDKFRREVEKLIPELGEVLPGADPFAVAATTWTFDQIRKAGGVALFCHPYWESKWGNVLPGAIVDELFKRRQFDALELISGFWLENSYCNHFQVTRCYHEWMTRGVFPVVGLSDSHGADHPRGLFNWNYTIVLAESDSFEDLAAAIRSGNCVAVEAPASERKQCYGSYRLSRYGHFLLDEYFPRHEELCRTEGEVMLDVLGGDKDVAQTLPYLSTRPAAWRKKAFDI